MRTRCTSQDGLTIGCETDSPRQAQPLDSYAKALGSAQRLVPGQKSGQFERAQTEALRLRKEMMRRQMEREAAPGYDYKRCPSRRQRKKVEMAFAHLKRILKLDRLRLRGPNGAKCEFLLAATVQNLRKMAKLIPMPSQMAPA